MARPPPEPPKPVGLTMDDLMSTSNRARTGPSGAATPSSAGDDLPRALGGRMRMDGNTHNRRVPPEEAETVDQLFGPKTAERARARATAPNSSADDLVGGKAGAKDRGARIESSLDDLFGSSKRR